ncbi:hypothetical protein C8Q74DRAFT_673383 [Fomes fomentarius]|nr:hypothetical protein C8Q74DRAFT_673383 [Fomes fomentarius]
MVSGLLQLDIDALLIICEELRPNRHLRPLASSCKYLRAIAAPVLFSGCSIKIARLVRWGELLPMCLWPIVRPYSPPHNYANSRRRAPSIFPLTVPTLLYFDAVVARLTHFHYHRPIYELSDNPYNEDGDARLVSIIASQAHQSMESLVIPSATAHLSTMLRTPSIWPRLRFCLYVGSAASFPDHSPPYSEGCLRSRVWSLSSLRTWNISQSGQRDCISHPPHGHSWKPLWSLILKDDQLYRHLPRGLRRLSLCCWPRHYHHPIQYNRFTMMTKNWYSPILKSSEMLHILQQCDVPELQQLDVEFIADKADATLLGLVSSSFPRLTSLHLHRYRDRSSGVVDVPVVDIANTLASLQELRVLFAHLDFKDAPHPYTIHNLRGAGEEYEPLHRALNDAANTFARSLAPSVRHICLLFRVHWINRWLPYRIGREGVGDAVAAYDALIKEIDGFP